MKIKVKISFILSTLSAWEGFSFGEKIASITGSRTITKRPSL